MEMALATVCFSCEFPNKGKEPVCQKWNDKFRSELDYLQRWSRIFQSEETETDFSIWIPTEISGIFGIMESTLGVKLTGKNRVCLLVEGRGSRVEGS